MQPRVDLQKGLDCYVLVLLANNDVECVLERPGSIFGCRDGCVVDLLVF